MLINHCRVVIHKPLPWSQNLSPPDLLHELPDLFHLALGHHLLQAAMVAGHVDAQLLVSHLHIKDFEKDLELETKSFLPPPVSRTWHLLVLEEWKIIHKAPAWAAVRHVSTVS